MTGFNLYETLRFVIPGAIAAVLVTLTLRLATGTGPLYAGGQAAGLIKELSTGTTFLVLALILGFVLYALDLPVRARIYTDGDPEHGITVPSQTLTALVREAHGPHKGWMLKRALPVYFLLMDAHLPTELHKKVYFFGGLYRIYFDARVLTASALTLGPLVGFVVVGDGRVAWGVSEVRPSHALAAGLSVALLIGAGAMATVLHRNASERRRARGEATKSKSYGQRLKLGLEQVRMVSLIIAGAQVAGLLLAEQNNVVLRCCGLLVATGALILWTLVELGPPPIWPPSGHSGPSGPAPLRGGLLNALKCPGTNETSFMPAQRSLVDLALLGPAMLSAANLTVEQGRPPGAVLWWGLLLGLTTFILSTRKHEVRLLNSFGDQSAWLYLNRTKIAARVQKLAPDESWT
ncbi:hypothetical protein [Phycicoccus sp. Root563]|uniref:hypothetical protein n=1 Tax=Phycicoccus sp. Root563 TaxID=1736562 RepID=UPI000A917AE9|nr:hypothetical protein [Phycicoccus sp. Root563]